MALSKGYSDIDFIINWIFFHSRVITERKESAVNTAYYLAQN